MTEVVEDADWVTVGEEVGKQLERVQNLPAVQQHEAIMARGELSVEEVVAQKDKIVEVMRQVMTDGVHYGLIPGIDKPTLLKPGAEAINVALRLAPHYESEKIFEGAHLTVVTRCVLKHIPTDLIVGTGEGMCSTRESKYAHRQQKRECPECGMETIIKGKEEFGGGYVCWKRQGGCGAKFFDDDARITEQSIGQVENPDLPDSWNTVLKMSDKRALIAAVLNATAASDVFTQDLEEEAAPPAGDASPPAGPAQARERSGEGPKGLPKPRSWKAIEEYVRAYGEPTWEAFSVFAAQSRLYLFGVDADLDKDAKNELFRITCIAAWTLRNSHDVEKFPPPNRVVMRLAWAAALDGTELEGPGWRMSPDETDRPEKSGGEGEQPTEEAPEDASAAEVEAS